jgi:two-component system CheB/CheR fusion protein
VVGVRCVPDDDHVVVEVADSGIGIDPAAVETMFEAFVQGPRSTTGPAGGLGLGLAISTALVQSHGGRIDAHSDGPGHGGLFRVRVPMISAGTRRRPEGPAPRVEGCGEAGRPLRILVVEDHADTADMIVQVLALRGTRCREPAISRRRGRP